MSQSRNKDECWSKPCPSRTALPPDQRLLRTGGLWGTLFEVLVAVETEAGERVHILLEVHLAVLVGVQKTHEFVVVALPELTLQKGCKVGSGNQDEQPTGGQCPFLPTHRANLIPFPALLHRSFAEPSLLALESLLELFTGQ